MGLSIGYLLFLIVVAVILVASLSGSDSKSSSSKDSQSHLSSDSQLSSDVSFHSSSDSEQNFSKNASHSCNLIYYTFTLMGYVARGAGRVNQDHIATAEHYMHLMQLDTALKKMAIDAFNCGKRADFDVKALASSGHDLCKGNDSLIAYLLEIQVQMALSDGILEDLEHQRLLEIASLLGSSSKDLEESIRQQIAEMNLYRNFRNQHKKSQRERGQQSLHKDNKRSKSDGRQSNSDYQRKMQYSWSGSYYSLLDQAYEVLGVS